MHHHSRASDLIFGLPLWLILMAFIIIVVLVGIYFHRKRILSDYLSTEERKELSDIEQEILRLIRQTGKPISQSEICDLIPIEPEEVAENLSWLQDKKLIEREWDSSDQTYLIKSVS